MLFRSPSGRQSLLFSITLLAASCNPEPPTQPPVPDAQAPATADARRDILALFDRYQVVGIGSPAHRNKDLDDFVVSLLREPDLPNKVNDIVVECGNSLYQPVLDRYIAGDDVPLSEARQVWRNVGQPSCAISILYEELFPLVRQINRKLPAEKKLRVLAGDPSVDWSRIKSAEDLMKFEDRDSNIALVMKNEVLTKHRKALMLFGIIHLLHGAEGLAVASYEKEYPNVTYVIAEHRGFGGRTPLAADNDALEARLASSPVPSLVPIQGSWLAELNAKYVFPQEEELPPTLTGLIDGYLYLGPRDLLLSQPIPASVILDNDFMAELGRRVSLTGESGGPMDPETIRTWAADSTVLLNPPATP